MKASYRIARKSEKNGAPHLDRTFLKGREQDKEFAPQVDRDRIDQNHYYYLKGDKLKHCQGQTKGMSLLDREKAFYEEHFKAYVDTKNEMYLKNSQPKCVRTIEQYYETNRTKPTEMIFQIGDKDHHPGDIKKDAERVLTILKKQGFTVITAAIHMDETTPHMHVRGCFISHDQDGHEMVNVTAFMKEHGIERPDLSHPNSRDNCPLKTWTANTRKLIEDMCINRGYDIDTTRAPKRDHMSDAQYKELKLQEDIQRNLDRTAEAQRLEQERQMQITEDLRRNAEAQELKEQEQKRKAKELSDREQELKEQEQAVQGKVLTVKQVQALQSKHIWSSTEKADVCVTAMSAAQQAERADKAERKVQDLTDENKDLKDTVRRQEYDLSQRLSQQDSIMIKGHAEAYKAEMERYKQILKAEGILPTQEQDRSIKMRM